MQEAEWIVEDIKNKRLDGYPLKDIAVIYRTHASGRAIFEKLLLAEIPFVTYGKNNESFYQNKFVAPLLSLMKATINETDADAMLNAASVLYISKNEMQATIDEIAYQNNGNIPNDLFSQVMKRIIVKKTGFQQRALMNKWSSIKSIKSMTAPQAIRELRRGAVDYEHQLELDERKTLTIHKEMVSEILDEFEIAARGFDNVKAFIDFTDRVEEKNQEMEELRKDPNIEAVRLMTIHASKGLEFETVYGIGFVEGILPHSSAITAGEKEDSSLTPQELLEEERRLGYVCLTRAKKYLYLSSPKVHRNKDVEISRFLLEGLGINKK